MKCNHHDLEFYFDDSWLKKAKVENFAPLQDHYLPITTDNYQIVEIIKFEPCYERAKNIGVFCDDKSSGETAEQRVIRILNWFRKNQEVEPVQAVSSKVDGFEYKLTHGSHRFHCAIALNFKSVPVKEGFDMGDPYA